MTTKDYHEQNYYELLDVSSSASQDEILNAYKKARSTYSPSSAALYTLFDKSEAEELLKLIDEAYSVLSNQFRRKEYDKRHSSNKKIGETMQHQQHAQPNQASSSPQSTLKTAAVDEHRAFNKTYTQLQGVKGVLIKNNAQVKSVPGKTRFGSYAVDTEFEKQMQEFEIFTGETLQKVRLYKNITLDQVSEFTKVSRAYLIAIENNDFTCLPAVVFLRGFLSQFAKALELDANKVTSSYIKNMSGTGQP